MINGAIQAFSMKSGLQIDLRPHKNMRRAADRRMSGLFACR